VELGEGEVPCDVLHGWLMLSCLKGAETVDRYSFCSFVCLKLWVDEQLPRVPEVFLESLDEESGE
jgi:hypothetical protein